MPSSSSLRARPRAARESGTLQEGLDPFVFRLSVRCACPLEACPVDDVAESVGEALLESVGFIGRVAPAGNGRTRTSLDAASSMPRNAAVLSSGVCVEAQIEPSRQPLQFLIGPP